MLGRTRSKDRRVLSAGGVVLAIALLVVSATASSASSSSSTKISSSVQAQLDRQNSASFWVVLSSKADLSAAPAIANWSARGSFVVDTLQAQAARTQHGVLGMLDSRGVKYQSYWIANAVLVFKADAATARALAARTDVARILPRWTAHIVDGTPGVRVTGPNTIEWNINNTRAPMVWQQFSDRGEGIVVASIDTGTQFNHPALVNSYRGNLGGGSFDHNYNWYDPLHWCSQPAPCDTFGHGTHTMGTMVGDDGGTNQIGMAPNVKWIEADALPDGNGTDQSLLGSGQWLLAPTDLQGNNPDPDMRPDIISNSWGIPFDDSDTWYQSTVQAWVAAGIFPAWAAGNEGSGCRTLREPGSYPESYTMGAHDINNNIASFSSRGPSPFNGGTTKPNITGPGVNVRSSLPGNTYGVLSGTSMATPHIAAAVALMWSAAPNLKGDIRDTERILSNTARSVSDLSCGGTAKFNDVWGHGRLDAFGAVKKAIQLFP
jgi:subtilisin family serine protease